MSLHDQDDSSENPSDDANDPLAVEHDLQFSELGHGNFTTSTEPESEEEGYSLEELSQTYADVMADGDQPEVLPPESDGEEGELPNLDELVQVTPRSILEAVLFVGKSDNSPISGKEIAKLMRGVSEKDVEALVDELTEVYAETDRALTIQKHPGGFQFGLAPDLEVVRERFYGKVRTISLNQPAIDCLALIAYQPGITREKLNEQRGQASNAILNQLVRRQLIEVRRPNEGKKSEPHYHPTDKLLELVGLGSLEDLPQVEDFE